MMTVEEIKQMMEDGFGDVTPLVKDMTHLLMDVYERGFKAGLKIGIKVARE